LLKRHRMHIWNFHMKPPSTSNEFLKKKTYRLVFLKVCTAEPSKERASAPTGSQSSKCGKNAQARPPGTSQCTRVAHCSSESLQRPVPTQVSTVCITLKVWCSMTWIFIATLAEDFVLSWLLSLFINFLIWKCLLIQSGYTHETHTFTQVRKLLRLKQRPYEIPS
jgi:hypothetical protein